MAEPSPGFLSLPPINRECAPYKDADRRRTHGRGGTECSEVLHAHAGPRWPGWRPAARSCSAPARHRRPRRATSSSRRATRATAARSESHRRGSSPTAPRRRSGRSTRTIERHPVVTRTGLHLLRGVRLRRAQQLGVERVQHQRRRSLHQQPDEHPGLSLRLLPGVLRGRVEQPECGRVDRALLLLHVLTDGTRGRGRRLRPVRRLEDSAPNEKEPCRCRASVGSGQRRDSNPRPPA